MASQPLDYRGPMTRTFEADTPTELPMEGFSFLRSGGVTVAEHIPAQVGAQIVRCLTCERRQPNDR
jgi:hypothetical protein